MRLRRTSRWSVGGGVGSDCGSCANGFTWMPMPDAIGCSGIGSVIGAPV